MKKLTVEKINQNTYYRTYGVELKAVQLIKYFQDLEKADRVQSRNCRYCFYMRTDILSGQAVTESHCGNCEAVVVCGNTDVPQFCDSCADTYRICAQCGSDLHGKRRLKL